MATAATGWPLRAAALRMLLVLLLAQLGLAARGQDPFGDDFGYQEGPYHEGAYDTGYPCAEPYGPVSYGQPQRPGLSGWIGAEYLRWELDGDRLPPLVTDAPATTPIDEAGVLGNPNTRILAGDEEIFDDWRDGFRIFGGIWLDDCHRWAIGGEYFRLGDDDFRFRVSDTAGRIIARPFFNTETGLPDAELVSIPNQLSGTVNIVASDDFEGAGLALHHCLWRCCSPCECGTSQSVNLITGYRYYRYDSALVIQEDLLVLPGTQTPLVPGTQIFVEDRFLARNDFHGGEIGIQGAHQRGWFWIDGMAKLALGNHRRKVIINGRTVNTVPGEGSATFQGGLLTSEVTNIGRHTDDEFVGIPEFRVGIGAMLTKGLSVRAGYNVIIWNDVVRVSSALPPNLAVDPRNLPPVQAGGGADPQFTGIRGSDLVVHGLSAGMEWSF